MGRATGRGDKVRLADKTWSRTGATRAMGTTLGPSETSSKRMASGLREPNCRWDECQRPAAPRNGGPSDAGHKERGASCRGKGCLPLDSGEASCERSASNSQRPSTSRMSGHGAEVMCPCSLSRRDGNTAQSAPDLGDRTCAPRHPEALVSVALGPRGLG